MIKNCLLLVRRRRCAVARRNGGPGCSGLLAAGASREGELPRSWPRCTRCRTRPRARSFAPRPPHGHDARALRPDGEHRSAPKAAPSQVAWAWWPGVESCRVGDFGGVPHGRTAASLPRGPERGPAACFECVARPGGWRARGLASQGAGEAAPGGQGSGLRHQWEGPRRRLFSACGGRPSRNSSKTPPPKASAMGRWPTHEVTE